MSVPITSRFLRQACTNASKWIVRAPQSRRWQPPMSQLAAVRTSSRVSRCFSTSVRSRAGLMPDAEDPEPPPKQPESRPAQATEVSDDEYHQFADKYLEQVNEKAEQIQESRQDVEVEYSAGVLSITMPPAGTYVINKQPPNKQIWLSSPTSGPKRFDWVVLGESMHQKEGGGSGDWIYLRDGSSLTELLKKELDIAVDLHGHEENMTPSSDPVE